MSQTCPTCNTGGIPDEVQACPVCGADLNETKTDSDLTTEGSKERGQAELAKPLPLAWHPDQTTDDSDDRQQLERAKPLPHSWHPNDDPDPPKMEEKYADIASAPLLAWEKPGFLLTRIWLTCWQVLLEPGKSFASLGIANFKNPHWYVYATAIIYAVVNFPFGAFTVDQKSLLEIWTERQNFEDVTAHLGMGLVLFAAFLLFGPVLIWIQAHAVSRICHFALWVYKATKLPYIATYKTIAYWEGSVLVVYALIKPILMIIQVYSLPIGEAQTDIPLLGLLGYVANIILLIWLAIRLMHGLASAHDTNPGRVFMALLSIVIVVMLGDYVFSQPIETASISVE